MRTRLLFLVVLAGLVSAQADDSSLPGAGYAAARYEALWTKSPFAVATADAAPDSPDYSLVGIAEIDKIFYASVIDKQNQDQHYLLSTDKPINGLTLVSVTRGKGASDTVAVIQKDGQPISLKLEAAPVAMNMPGVPNANPGMQMPGAMTPNIPMPGSGAPGNTPFNMGQPRPPVRLHRFPIHLPPVPTQPPPPPRPVPIQPPPPPPQ